MRHLHPRVVVVGAVQVLGRLVQPQPLRLQVVLRVREPKVRVGVQWPFGVPLRLVAAGRQRLQDGRREQLRPDEAQPTGLHAAGLAVELPAVLALQVGDQRVGERARHARAVSRGSATVSALALGPREGTSAAVVDSNKPSTGPFSYLKQ